MIARGLDLSSLARESSIGYTTLRRLISRATPVRVQLGTAERLLEVLDRIPICIQHPELIGPDPGPAVIISDELVQLPPLP